MNVGLRKRVAAWGIDFLITEGITILMTIGAGIVFGLNIGGEGFAESGPLLLITVWFFVPRILEWIYFAFFESSKYQATPGKQVLKIVVTNVYGEPISFGRATVRYFSKWVGMLLLGLGIIPIFFTKRKQTAHDLFAGTVVVDQACCDHSNVSDFTDYMKKHPDKIKKI